MLAQLTHDVGVLAFKADRMLDSIQSGLSSVNSQVRKTSERVVHQEGIIALLHDLPLHAIGGLLKELAGYRTDPHEKRVLDIVGRYVEKEGGKT